jgi:hypothetical protein
MTESNILQPGQELSLNWRELKSRDAESYNFLTKMKLTPDNNGNPYATVFCRYFSKEGVSVYITRGYTFGGDIEAFLPSKNIMWQHYFKPLKNMNASYAHNKHYEKIFPQDFI